MPLSPFRCIFSLSPRFTESLSLPPFPPSFSDPRSFSFLPSSAHSPLDMGVFNPLTFPLFSLIFLLTFAPLFADNDSRKVPPSGIAPSNPVPSPPPPSPQVMSDFSTPFKPSIAIVVGILTTIFSITFLLLLYAKHCKRGNGATYDSNSRGLGAPSVARKNSGIDRVVIESLPIFRFGSLRGQKDGLECAVCLTRFEPSEVLRLLPKCKHAFHVECVDTWLDAHSTCPLCRYRVDPEDILLIGDSKILHENQPVPPPRPAPPLDQQQQEDPDPATDSTRRNGKEPESWARQVSGRHSSAGETGTGSGVLQIVVQKTGEEAGPSRDPTPFYRRSLDSWISSRKSRSSKSENTASSSTTERKRKDGLLLLEGTTAPGERKSMERRLEHRIVVSDWHAEEQWNINKVQQRWSDAQASDLLYLRTEMIMSDSRRMSSRIRRKPPPQHHQEAINSRSVSEITGLSRFSGSSGRSRHPNNNNNNNNSNGELGRAAALVPKWKASHSQSQTDVGSETTAAANC